MCLFSAVAQNPENISQKDWAGALARYELSALEQSLNQAYRDGGMTLSGLHGAVRASSSLRRELHFAGSSDGIRLASLKYLALTDYLALAQLRLVEPESKTAAHLGLVQVQAELLLQELTDSVAVGDESVFLGRLRSLEASADQAKSELVLSKRLESLQEAVLRLQALSLLNSGDRKLYGSVVNSFQSARKNLALGSSAVAEKQIELGLAELFGERAQTWDGRHLWHSLGLIVLVKSLPQSERVGLESLLESLLKTNDSEVYSTLAREIEEKGSSSLQRLDAASAVLFLSPLQTQKTLRASLRTMQGWLPQVRSAFLETESFLQSFDVSYRNRVFEKLKAMDAALASLAGVLRNNTDFALLQNLQSSLPMMQTVALHALEASMDHSSSATGFFEVWLSGIARVKQGERFIRNEDFNRLRLGFRVQRSEGTRRAWLNRQNIAVASVGVSLAAEAIAIPFTGGLSGAAMPATLATVSTVSVAAANSFLIANSALNIADRTKAQGLKGLANIDTAVDALVLLSFAPRPMLGGTAATTTMGKLGQRSLKALAGLQYSSATLLTLGGAAYGTYLFYNAQSLSEEMLKEGVIVSPAEIRRKGLVSIALAALAAEKNGLYYERGVAKNGKAFENEIAPYTMTKGTLPSLMKEVRQLKALKDYYNAHPGAWGKVGTAGYALGYLGMDALVGTEALIFSYSNLDSNFVNHAEKVHPLPDLNEGETAVILVGFEQGDYFLYAGALAPHSNRHEANKYGGRLFVYTYDSPEHLMKVLEKHRQEHGPVRYLKISTHGRPGRLFTPAINSGPEGALGLGWIDEAWFSNNQQWLREKSRTIFAAKAQIRLWACLVGANLDVDAGEGVDVGDRFLKKIGSTWLVNGGSVDASTRILVGVDATLGVLADEGVRAGLRGEKRPRLVLPVTHLDSEEFSDLDSDSSDSADGLRAKFEETLEMGKTMGSRLVSIFSHWPPVWWEYGVNLEGPFWQSRYKSMEFPPTP